MVDAVSLSHDIHHIGCFNAAASIGSFRKRRLIDLSGLVHNLNIVTVGVEYPGCGLHRLLNRRRMCSAELERTIRQESLTGVRWR